MSIRRFRGGVHPPEFKFSAGRPVEVLPPPGEMVLPLSMHLGAPAKPLVQGGERVLRGQALAEPSGFVSAYIHSPVSGVVRKIEPRDHPLGKPLPSIVIDNDGQDETVAFTPLTDWQTADPAQLLEAVQRAGVVGMGGATFPTHVKLKPPAQFKIDTVIANGVECEPYLTADHRLMLEEPERILTGLRIVLRILGVRKGRIGIERNKPDAIALLRQKTAGADDIEVVDLHVRYPQGAEKQLIFACTGRQVPTGGLPMNVGAVVQNVGTLAAIHDAVVLGQPVMERIVTVTGQAIKEPKNLRVRCGTPIHWLIEAAGGAIEPFAKVISGGPMMGLAQYNLNTPVIKGSSGVLCLPAAMVQAIDLRPCIRCGACIRGCPAGLAPTDLVHQVQANNFPEAESLGVLDCIECGSCAFGCPSGIPLVQWLRLGKAEVMARRKKSQ
ncbi:MAG: electron transport complex subunit RsxC [Myxococcales bacterium]|nr:electron transport complex subunit RsxC [Myxococcales bacterium]